MICFCQNLSASDPFSHMHARARIYCTKHANVRPGVDSFDCVRLIELGRIRAQNSKRSFVATLPCARCGACHGGVSSAHGRHDMLLLRTGATRYALACALRRGAARAACKIAVGRFFVNGSCSFALARAADPRNGSHQANSSQEYRRQSAAQARRLKGGAQGHALGRRHKGEVDRFFFCFVRAIVFRVGFNTSSHFDRNRIVSARARLRCARFVATRSRRSC